MNSLFELLKVQDCENKEKTAAALTILQQKLNKCMAGGELIEKKNVSSVSDKVLSQDGRFILALEDLKKNNEKFVDQDFKPEASSLNITPEKVDRWQHFEWKRATEILMLNKDMEKREIFSGKIDHKSIRQGELGNVYFLSVLSILAEKPHRIRDLFITQDVNDHGFYVLRMCVGGEWVQIIIDDFVPCYADQPVFSNTKGRELWVLLAEKAWAKIHRSYQSIEGGFSDEVFHELTGAPTEFVRTKDELFLDKLTKACENKALVAASSSATGNSAAKEALNEVGMTAAHCYAILGLHEIIG